MVDSMSRLWKQLCKQWFPEIEGSQISWVKDTTTGAITLTVIEEDGSTTTIKYPDQGILTFEQDPNYTRLIVTNWMQWNNAKVRS